MYRGKWSLAFAVLLPLLCLVTAIAYVVEPHLSALYAGAADGAVLRKPPPPLAYKVLLLAAIACAAGWFIHAFTGDPLVRRREQVKFAYFFVIASFAVLMIPPFVKSQALGSEPIGIVSGCVADADAVAQLRCDPDQRLIPRTGAQAEEGRPAATIPVAPKDAALAGAASMATVPRPERNQWLVNIGGALRPQSTLPCKVGSPEECLPGSPGNRVDITGGVVVPLPFVIVALFGGAVSLSRRVPEIQKRSEPGFPGSVAEPAIDARQAREELVFQIMQFASAPLIAITAYQVVEPTSQAGAVALAFLAGFGSETILLMIRGVANGLQPRNVLPGLPAPVPAPPPAPAPAWMPGQGAVGPVAAFAPRQLGIQAAGDPPVEPVRIRLCVDDDLEAGSAALSVDGVLVGVPGDGCVELPLAPGRPYRVEAHGRRAGREVHGGQTLTVNADDEARPLQLALA